MLRFKEEGHKYECDENITWTSVTTLIHKHTQHFDADAVASKVIKNKKSKWHGLTKERVLELWDAENKRATTMGSAFHLDMENQVLGKDTIIKQGVPLTVFKPDVREDVKYAPKQRLKDGIYPEFFAYLRSAQVCGQADYVEVVDGRINISDYKTNKKIDLESYKDFRKGHKMMTGPLSHIMDCNYYHYTLQMSIYMYIMLRHNPKLKPGTMTIPHIIFEKIGEDKYHFPIYMTDDRGNAVVKNIVYYKLDYLEKEVHNLIEVHKLNLNL